MIDAITAPSKSHRRDLNPRVLNPMEPGDAIAWPHSLNPAVFDNGPRPNSNCGFSLLHLAACAAVSLAFFPAPAQTSAQIPAQTPSLTSQTLSPAPAAVSTPLLAAASAPAALPDDPSAALASTTHESPVAGEPLDTSSSSGDGQSPAPQKTPSEQRAESTRSQYVPAGWEVQAPLSAQQKVVMGVRGLYTPFSLIGMVLAAGYAQVADGQPNYGVNRVAFGKRMGATLLRDSTEEILSTSILPPLLHEDPRYYVEGPKYSFVHRTLYSITRPLVTRADNGRSTVNGSLLLGYAAASALTYPYYPQINQNFHDTAATFGGAVGGAAVGFFVTEFSADVLQKLHLGKLL